MRIEASQAAFSPCAGVVTAGKSVILLKIFGVFFVTLLAAFSTLAATGDFADIPALKKPVTDTTGTLSAAEEASIDAVLRAFEQKKGSQIAVLIVATTHAPDSVFTGPGNPCESRQSRMVPKTRAKDSSLKLTKLMTLK